MPSGWARLGVPEVIGSCSEPLDWESLSSGNSDRREFEGVFEPGQFENLCRTGTDGAMVFRYSGSKDGFVSIEAFEGPKGAVASGGAFCGSGTRVERCNSIWFPVEAGVDTYLTVEGPESAYGAPIKLVTQLHSYRGEGLPCADRLEICDPSLECVNGPEGRFCRKEAVLPEISSLVVRKVGPRGKDLMVRVVGTQESDEFWDLDLTLLDDDGAELKPYGFTMTFSPGSFDETLLRKEVFDFHPSAEEVEVRISKGSVASTQTLKLESPPLRSLGEACDHLGIENRCGDEMACAASGDAFVCESWEVARRDRCEGLEWIDLEWPFHETFEGSTVLPALWYPSAELLREGRSIMDLPEGAIRWRVQEAIEQVTIRTAMMGSSTSVVSLYEGCGESGTPIASVDEYSAMHLPSLDAGEYLIVLHERNEGAIWEVDVYSTPD